jgi:hypothetical protein
MKKIFFITVLIILNIIMSDICVAQMRDSLIQLTLQIGDTISLSERNYYDLFPNIQGFEYAMIYIRDDTIAVSRITYLSEYGESIDTAFTNNVNYIGNLRAYIKQVDNEELVDSKSVIVTTRDGVVIKGMLKSINQNYIIIIPDLLDDNKITGVNDNSMTLTSYKTQSIFIEGESYAFKGWLIGTLTGATIGGLIGLTTEDTQSHPCFLCTREETTIGLGLLLGGLGGTIGLVAGILSSTEDKTIEVDEVNGFVKLKDYLAK